eukprot:4036321-Amphidinium_carterae.2
MRVHDLRESRKNCQQREVVQDLGTTIPVRVIGKAVLPALKAWHVPQGVEIGTYGLCTNSLRSARKLQIARWLASRKVCTYTAYQYLMILVVSNSKRPVGDRGCRQDSPAEFEHTNALHAVADSYDAEYIMY